MTQRVEHTTVMDRLAIDDLVTGYAIAVDDGDWTAYRALFVPEGRVDYRSAGGIAGSVTDVADWLAEMMRRFPVRQHLIVNRRIGIELRDGGAPGDMATVQADYLNPMHLAGPEDAPPARAPEYTPARQPTRTPARRPPCTPARQPTCTTSAPARSPARPPPRTTPARAATPSPPAATPRAGG
ncbi:nuclear transport factor 2 family protein [Streptomyces sp. Ac-502]|uniref:nuclear transport factor 2 family protein n=1 Tax=Streptomyces sp. Ac-502 TaxID=3342801 RepID=UPI0038627B76